MFDGSKRGGFVSGKRMELCIGGVEGVRCRCRGMRRGNRSL